MTSSEKSDPARLRVTIENMDALSQSGFSKISAIVQMAKIWLQTPLRAQNLEVLFEALELIDDTAQGAQDGVNSAAEGVGCNFVDEAQRRRWHAQKQINSQARGQS